MVVGRIAFEVAEHSTLTLNPWAAIILCAHNESTQNSYIFLFSARKIEMKADWREINEMK